MSLQLLPHEGNRRPRRDGHLAHAGATDKDHSMVPAAPQLTLLSLFGVFFRVGLYSFGGGISAWVHREIVDVRHWVTEEEFMSGFALGQILPGVNSTNLTIYIGAHLRGAIGAAVALAGLLSGPFVVVLAVGISTAALIAIPGLSPPWRASRRSR